MAANYKHRTAYEKALRSEQQRSWFVAKAQYRFDATMRGFPLLVFMLTFSFALLVSAAGVYTNGIGVFVKYYEFYSYVGVAVIVPLIVYAIIAKFTGEVY